MPSSCARSELRSSRREAASDCRWTSSDRRGQPVSGHETFRLGPAASYLSDDERCRLCFSCAPDGRYAVNRGMIQSMNANDLLSRCQTPAPAYELFYDEPVEIVRGEGACPSTPTGVATSIATTTPPRWGTAARASSTPSFSRDNAHHALEVIDACLKQYAS
jgi:hypothetical protein